MNRSEKRDRDSSPATLLIATALAVIAGFGTIYLSLAPSDNGQSPSSGADRAAGDSAQGGGGASMGGSLAGLNKGAMAAFVARPSPQELPAIAFADANGQTKPLSDWRGKVVLLNLWATWCAPCREEMPALDSLQDELGGEDFEVVAVSIDRGGIDKPKSFLDEIGIKNLGLYTDSSGKLFAELKAVGMPTTLLIDRQGREIGRLVGPAHWDAAEAIKLIKAAIAAPQSA